MKKPSVRRSEYGVAGMLATDRSSYAPGQGHHGSLSPFDMHNTLIAAGPDFRSGQANSTPSGNIDIAPTVLWLLGWKPNSSMDGRVLSEALTIPGPPKQSSGGVNSTNLTTQAVLQKGTWQQYLKRSQVNGVDYFDEGNGQLK